MNAKYGRSERPCRVYLNCRDIIDKSLELDMLHQVKLLLTYMHIIIVHIQGTNMEWNSL